MKPQKYRVIYEKDAMKDLERIPSDIRTRIFEKVNALAREEMWLDIKKLKWYVDHIYRLRVWDYRVIYEKEGNELIILVLEIGHRKDIYE